METKDSFPEPKLAKKSRKSKAQNFPLEYSKLAIECQKKETYLEYVRNDKISNCFEISEGGKHSVELFR